MLAAYLPCVVVEPSHKQRRGGQCRHRGRIMIVAGRPMSEARLVGGQPFQSPGDHAFDVGVLFGGQRRGRPHRRQGNHQHRAGPPKRGRDCAAERKRSPLAMGGIAPMPVLLPVCYRYHASDHVSHGCRQEMVNRRKGLSPMASQTGRAPGRASAAGSWARSGLPEPRRSFRALVEQRGRRPFSSSSTGHPGRSSPAHRRTGHRRPTAARACR